MPYSDLPQISDIIIGHDGYRDKLSAELSGQTLWFFNNSTDEKLSYQFLTDTFLEIIEIREGYESSTIKVDYEAIEIGEALYFVDIVQESHNRTALIIDYRNDLMLRITVKCRPEEFHNMSVMARQKRLGSSSCVELSYESTAITAPEKRSSSFSNMPYDRTDELVGARVLCSYSDSHVYDHIYLSRNSYTWYCVSGPDQGLGDYEECQYFKLRENIYLVCWCEKLMPMAGITIENYDTMRSVAKICGFDTHTGEYSRTLAGADLRVLSTTHYPRKPKAN